MISGTGSDFITIGLYSGSGFDSIGLGSGFS
jgi:hypothetical protein